MANQPMGNRKKSCAWKIGEYRRIQTSQIHNQYKRAGLFRDRFSLFHTTTRCHSHDLTALSGEDDAFRRERFAETMRRLGQWFTEGKIKPHISATFPLERAADALRLMADRKVTGKVVLTTDN